MSLTTTSSTPMVSDILNYVRRIIKQPNGENISDNTIADYINRFYIYDVPARVQLFDLKTQYSLELTPNVDQYNAPVTYLPGGAVVPTYQTYITPAYVDGYQIVMQQSHAQWMQLFPNVVNNQFQQNGNGTGGPYTFLASNPPFIQGHRDQNIQPLGNTINPGGAQEGLLTSNVYVTAIDVNNNLNVIQDDPINYTMGNLISYDVLNPGNAPSIVGTVNYLTGQISATFLYAIPTNQAINHQVIPYSPGRPQAVLFFDNTFSFRPIPSQPFLFRIDAYYNPATFLATGNAVPYRYMAEYIARGTARKILQDYGDVEQLQFYEGPFKEQENFVLRKTYRQNSNVRVPTPYQHQMGFNQGISNGY